MKMSKAFTAAAVVLGFAVAAPAFAKNANVKIVNKSDWKIEQLYFSPIDDSNWGSDQLQKHVIAPGGEFTLTGIPCNSWDVKLVDEDGDECVVESVDICGQSDTWVVSSKDLLKCQSGS
jgi:hypothetical protein